MISVSLVLLTWNRFKSVSQSLLANINSANYPIKEIVHVDNGSSREFWDCFSSKWHVDTQVKHATNLGVARGYNVGLALATGSHVVITGCDRVMPKDWLKNWVDAFEKIPNTGVVSCYTSDQPGRMRAEKEVINGVTIRRAMPVEARMHSRDFLFKAGFFREDFGRYGYEDSEWLDRAEKTARELGLINYVLPDMGLAEHLADDDFNETVEGLPYKDWKLKQYGPSGAQLFRRCWELGSPHYNPFARVEKELPVSRFDYVAYDERSQALQAEAKELCQKLESFIDRLSIGRPHALALTKLEECYMWIGKLIRDQQLAGDGDHKLQEERKNG